MIHRSKEILLYSDLSLSAFTLGWAMVVWGIIALATSHATPPVPTGLTDAGAVRFWFWNYVIVGAGLVHCAYLRFPPLQSLLVGGYSVLVWAWVATMRVSSPFTSEVTLHAVVVFIGCLLVQRSGRR